MGDEPAPPLASLDSEGGGGELEQTTAELDEGAVVLPNSHPLRAVIRKANGHEVRP